MAISLERIRNRMDDLKKSLAAIDSRLTEFRGKIDSAIGISDPLIQAHLFDAYSEMLEVSARLSIYAGAPLDRVDKLDQYFSERGKIYDLMLHGIPPSRGISESRDLLKMAFYLSALNECEIWKYSGKLGF